VHPWTNYNIKHTIYVPPYLVALVHYSWIRVSLLRSPEKYKVNWQFFFPQILTKVFLSKLFGAGDWQSSKTREHTIIQIVFLETSWTPWSKPHNLRLFLLEIWRLCAVFCKTICCSIGNRFFFLSPNGKFSPRTNPWSQHHIKYMLVCTNAGNTTNHVSAM
jgi:hypothetical protein